MTAKKPSKSALITAALAQLAKDGWTESALTRAEQHEGYASGTYRAYFPGGIADFTHAFHEWIDEGMEAALAELPSFETSKVREKIYQAVMARLVMMEPYKEAVRRLMGHQLLPWNGARAVEGLGRAADAMWKAAGDRSTDYNYYTKRILLSGVYAASLRFWLRDDSANHADTRAYLRRRIADVLKVGQAMGGLKTRFGSKAA